MGRGTAYGLAGLGNWLSGKLELSRGGGAHNIRPMEGLRGFAALLVFGYHYLYFVEPYLGRSPGFAEVVSTVSRVGNTGVDLFFVLSGFLIYGSLMARPQPLGAYVARRVLRIYPAFLVVFSLYVGLSYAFPGISHIPSAPADALAYLGANLLLLGPLLVPVAPLVPVTWSLSYEVFYYALTPLLVVGFDLRGRSARWRPVFFGLLAVAYLGVCMVFGGHSRLVMFVAGVLLYETLTHTRARPPGALPTTLLCLAGLAGYTVLYRGLTDVPLSAALLFGAYFVLCFHLFATRGGPLRRIFEWTPLRLFGNMSYSFYLTHVLAMRVLTFVLPGSLFTVVESAPLVYLGFLPLFFLASLLPAFGLYLLVERPLSLKRPQRTRPDTARSALARPVQPGAHETPRGAPLVGRHPVPDRASDPSGFAARSRR